MRIKLKRLPSETIEEFADRHSLTMCVYERSHANSDMRFYAHFEKAEVKEGPCLCGVFGNGSTPELAIKAYARCISNTTLVIDAFNDRRELIVETLR